MNEVQGIFLSRPAAYENRNREVPPKGGRVSRLCTCQAKDHPDAHYYIICCKRDRDAGLCCHDMSKCVVVYILRLLFSVGLISLLVFLSLLHKCIFIFITTQ